MKESQKARAWYNLKCLYDSADTIPGSGKLVPMQYCFLIPYCEDYKHASLQDGFLFFFSFTFNKRMQTSQTHYKYIS